MLPFKAHRLTLAAFYVRGIPSTAQVISEKTIKATSELDRVGETQISKHSPSMQGERRPGKNKKKGGLTQARASLAKQKMMALAKREWV